MELSKPFGWVMRIKEVMIAGIIIVKRNWLVNSILISLYNSLTKKLSHVNLDSPNREDRLLTPNLPPHRRTDPGVFGPEIYATTLGLTL